MKKTLLPGATAALILLATFVHLTVTQTLPDGFKIETTRRVECTRKSKARDTLDVHYRGTLQNGNQFDSSYDRGQSFQFKLGVGEVIKGWDLGMADMCPGEARKLTIPPRLGYGSRNTGSIPPNSVLIFDTELLHIVGVAPETTPLVTPESEPKDAAAAKDASSQSDTAATHNADKSQANELPKQGSADGPASESDENKGECKLLGRFALLVQGALGLLAFMALVWKRWREKPRRPVLVWFFDVSKQVVGSLLMHFSNLFLSILSSGGLELQVAPTDLSTTKGEDRNHPNPCSFYLLNLAIDTTIGIAILVFFLRVFHAIFARTPLANPPESLKSGNYGHPPNWRWWVKQAFIYFLGLFAMKFCVFLMFQFFPWLGWVGDWALRWTEGREWVQITFVMLIFPLAMNMAQYWIIDSFIKDPAADYDYDRVQADDVDDDAAVSEGLIGSGRVDDAAEQPIVQRIVPSGGRVVAVGGGSVGAGDGGARLKEANATPVPIEYDSDADERPARHRRMS